MGNLFLKIKDDEDEEKTEENPEVKIDEKTETNKKQDKKNINKFKTKRKKIFKNKTKSNKFTNLHN